MHKLNDNLSIDKQGKISLRDYFAAHAITGLLAANEPGSLEDQAIVAYSVADAMLFARTVDYVE